MNQRRSIQDIIPPARSQPIRGGNGTRPEPPQRTEGRPPRMPKVRKKGAAAPGPVWIIVAVVAVVGSAFGIVSTVFHRADIALTLRTFEVPTAGSFDVAPDAGALSFLEREVSETLTKTIPRSGSEQVEERASGTITIFNAYSKSSQRLITNTRFESPEGLIYRIQGPVVVPGYTTSSGKVIPGSVDVTVYADEAGARYNIGATDFTIPGLKGSAQYDDMYARSEEPLSGGFVGEKAIVSPEVRDAAVADLKSELDRKVRAAMRDAAAEGEIFFPDTLSISFVVMPEASIEDGASIEVVAHGEAALFSEERLAQAIADNSGITYENPLSIANADQLTVRVEPSEETEGHLILTISGRVQLVGAYNQERFLQDIAGKDRRSAGVVLAGYPAIADMKITVYPFWRGTLPEKTDRLTIHSQ